LVRDEESFCPSSDCSTQGFPNGGIYEQWSQQKNTTPPTHIEVEAVNLIMQAVVLSFLRSYRYLLLLKHHSAFWQMEIMRAVVLLAMTSAMGAPAFVSAAKPLPTLI
jgi:hypothetical protein